MRVHLPYKIVDRSPEIYRYASEISPFSKRSKLDVFRIAIHVRRGDLFVVDSDRMLPNSYYIKIVNQVCDILNEMNVEFSCDLYTELPTKPFVATSEHHGISGRIDENVQLDPSQNSIEDFNILPNLNKLINIDQIETLSRMATADVLIMSRSSFSYLAAIFNRKGTILYHPFWHAPLSHWMVTGEDAFSHASMRRHIQRFKDDSSD